MTTPSQASSASSPDTAQQKASSRLPSLTQLAARINPNPNTSSPTSQRPRLAANFLRNGSNSSIATTATVDSMAVNVPNTRSTSPTAISTPPTLVTTPTNENIVPGEALTTEKLEEHNQESVAEKTVAEKKIKGYKNIPSLDAITARLAKTKALSIDGTSKPPEAEMIDDPKTPGFQMKAPEHPLQYSWTIYHDSKAKVPYAATPGQPSSAPSSGTNTSAPNSSVPESATAPYTAAPPPESGDYEAGLTVIGEFDSVESFCRYFNWLKPPSKLEKNSNYHLFKSGIKPMWEDEANANGGKWVLTMKSNPVLLDRCWSWLAMALVGQELEENNEICGAVVSLRTKVDRIQVWTRSKEDVEKLNAIGKKIVKTLDISEADGIGFEFQFNTEDRPLPNKFLSIQAIPQTSYRSTFGQPASINPQTRAFGNSTLPSSAAEPSSAGPANNFGSFSTSGSAWRPRKHSHV